MTGNEIFIWTCIVFGSDVGAILSFRLYDTWKNRRLDLGCDSCKEVVQLARTPDKQAYLCRGCYSAYVTEHFPNLDPNLKKIFRKIRRKR